MFLLERQQYFFAQRDGGLVELFEGGQHRKRGSSLLTKGQEALVSESLLAIHPYEPFAKWFIVLRQAQHERKKLQ